MKRVYWRPQGVSRRALVLIALIAVGALTLVERFPVQTKQPYHDDKLAAARLTRDAFKLLKSEKQRLGIPLDSEGDPHQTGMIGTALTPVTSNTGYLTAKRASINPNFAAVVVQMLKRAGLQRGDLIAVGSSGSFPALNVAAFAAIQTLGLEPIVISSASASEWGANDVGFLWLDMERVLVEHQVFGFRSVAASLGGMDDRGFGMSKHGRSLLSAAIDRNALIKIEPKTIVEAIERRMQIYQENAGERPIKAYLNVGGGTASVGTQIGKKQFKPGLNLEPPRGAGLMDSVMLRFSERGAPVIHMTGISQLAKQHGLRANSDGIIPPVGEGEIYVKAEYNRWLALGGIIAVLAAMLAFIRLDVGLRILRVAPRRKQAPQPQQMV
jgi:poly-gamma-glutamate system protein